MFKTLLNSLFAVLYSCFQFVIVIFKSIGIEWIAAVTLMVLVSAVLRLFVAQFAGSSVTVNIGGVHRDKWKLPKTNRRMRKSSDSEKNVFK